MTPPRRPAPPPPRRPAPPSLEPRAGFHWSRVRWDPPNAEQSDLCSYCSAPVGDCALRLWAATGAAAVFCDPCAADIFGIKTFD